MSEYFEFDVFLSDSAKDRPVVQPLAERLKADGLRVWFDQWQIKPGHSIPARIEEGLERSRVLVLCMSANAFGSDWARLESGTFRFRDPLNKEWRFLPLRMDDTQAPGSLGQFLYIDWRPGSESGEYSTLLESCGVPAAAPAQSSESQLIEKILSLGHTDGIRSVAINPDGRRALSGSEDNTLRPWDLDSGSSRVLEGHSDSVRSVAFTRDGRYALSAAVNGVLRIWDLAAQRSEPVVPETGLSMRPSDSTVGSWATQWNLPGPSEHREIWLWDFGGQADQRLIHQLYMEDTALAVLVFDGQKADFFETLAQWDRDLTRASAKPFTKLLVAGGVDAGGLRVSRHDVEVFGNQRGYLKFLETSANTIPDVRS